MKKLIPILFVLASCSKMNITPGNYTMLPPSKDTSNWQNSYVNGGNINNTNWNGNQNNGPWIGTTWVLTYFKPLGAFPPLPIDTIMFIDNQNYTINNGAVRLYNITSGVLSSYNITLYNHFPFGSGNYSAQISNTFVSDGVILNANFNDINSTTRGITASFRKL